MVWLSGMRGQNVVDKGDEYYERVFDRVVYDMTQCKDDEERHDCLNAFRYRHEYTMHALTKERIAELRRRLRRELGAGVIWIFDDVFPDGLTGEMRWVIDNIDEDDYPTAVRRLKNFRSRHSLTQEEVNRFDEMFHTRYSPERVLSDQIVQNIQWNLGLIWTPWMYENAEALYAFKHVFPDAREREETQLLDKFYEALSFCILFKDHKELVEFMEGLRTECDFTEENIVRFEHQLEYIYGRNIRRLRRFQNHRHARYDEIMGVFHRVFRTTLALEMHRVIMSIEGKYFYQKVMKFKMFRDTHVLSVGQLQRFKELLLDGYDTGDYSGGLVAYAFQEVYPNVGPEPDLDPDGLYHWLSFQFAYSREKDQKEILGGLKRVCNFDVGRARKLKAAVEEEHQLGPYERGLFQMIFPGA
jgi:hypothetical protein